MCAAQNRQTIVSTSATPHTVPHWVSACIEGATLRVLPTSNKCPGQQLVPKTGPSPHEPSPPPPLLPSMHLCRRPQQRHAVVQIMGRGTLVFVAWLQVSRLSGFRKRKVARAAHAAIVHSLSTSPHDHHKTVEYMYYIAPHMPTPKCCAINMTLWWLKKHVHWRGGAYGSWIIHPSLSPCHQTAQLCVCVPR